MGALRLGLARRRGASLAWTCEYGRLGTWRLGDLGTLGLLVTGWLGSADGLVERRASSALALALAQRGQGTERMREAKLAERRHGYL